MIMTIIGVILLLIPYLLIVNFKRRMEGFFCITLVLIEVHLFLALITQFFGVFNYGVVLGVNVLFCILALIKVDYQKLKKPEIKIDWIFIVVLVILSILFYSLHFNYTGDITTISEPIKEVKNLQYGYPYYSDEWVAVSLVKYSISTGKLPQVNPLWYDSSFPNAEMAFFSFISEFFLLLDLNPLTTYVWFSFLSGIFICLLIYFILRANEISKPISGLVALAVPYIINGANLPGIWYLIAIILGIICLLIGFFFFSIKNVKMSLFSGFLSILFYPPLFLFFTPSLLAYFYFNDYESKNKKYILWYFGLIFIVLIFLVLFLYINGSNIISIIGSKLFYPAFENNAIPQYVIYKIIPIPILLLALFGLFNNIKKKAWLVTPIAVGLVFWLYYSSSLSRIIIGYERAILVSSLMIFILAGFGLRDLYDYLKIDSNRQKKYVWNGLVILLFVLFFIGSFVYTQRDDWKELKLDLLDSNDMIMPAAPANGYLTQEDLRLFENIKEKRFLAPPWKGLVVGVSTNNYPLHTKQSTITNEILSYGEFMAADCSKKNTLKTKYEMDYVYSIGFNCPGFKMIDKSSEGLYLYMTE